jgi:hypothetical protein
MTTLKKQLILRLALFIPVLLLAGPAPLSAGPKGAYTVVRGDCLWRIAARPDVLGDPWRWPLLLQGNRALLQDPDHIEPGWTLKVPLNPSASQIAEARAFARAYRVPVASASAPAAAAAPPLAAPPGRMGAWVIGFVVAVALAVLGALILLAVAIERLMERQPELPSDFHPAPLREALTAAKRVAPIPAAQATGPVPPVGLFQPTESEAILRAEDGPDPLPHDEHRHAA